LVPLLVRPATATEYDTIFALTADVFERERLAGPAYVEILRDAPSPAALPNTELLVAVDGSP
jgi:hypothetical protein